MAQTTEWLQAIWNYNEEGEVEHINGPVLPSHYTIESVEVQAIQKANMTMCCFLLYAELTTPIHVHDVISF